MYRSRSSTHIIDSWQDEVEQSVEAGSSPILELGVSTMVIDDVISLAAMQRWGLMRTDISTPYVPNGGSDPLWIASLLRPLRRSMEAQASEPVVIYAGVNGAEYLLTVAMLHSATKHRAGNTSEMSAIPVSYFAPQSQPGMSVSWDALPFFALNIVPDTSQFGPTELDNSIEDSDSDPIEDWLAWAGLLLALFLVLLAILL
jgi:hypothetical protein